MCNNPLEWMWGRCGIYPKCGKTEHIYGSEVLCPTQDDYHRHCPGSPGEDGRVA